MSSTRGIWFGEELAQGFDGAGELHVEGNPVIEPEYFDGGDEYLW
jgi:hypothetical protein